MPRAAHRVQHGRARRVDVGRRARLLPGRRRRAAVTVQAVARRADPSAARDDGRLFRAELGADGDRRRPRHAAVSRSRSGGGISSGSSISYLAAASLAFCLDSPDPAGEPDRDGRDHSAAGRLPPDAAVVVRTRGRCAPPSHRHGSALPVHGRDARDGDRRERRRDAQPRASGAGVRDRPGAGARHHGRARVEGDRSGRAPARHREAGGARAHPQQAGQADGGGVREDEAPRRRGRGHPLARAVPVSGRADRALPSRELGRHAATRAASPARTSRSARGFCRSSTASTRSRRIGRIAAG